MPEIWFPNLGIVIDKLSRTAATVGGFNLYWYGIFIGLGIVGAVFYVMYEANRTGQSVDEYLDFGVWAIILSILGARVYYILFKLDYYLANPMKIFAFREGGLAIYGAVITGILCGLVYCIKKKKSFFLMADTVLPSLLIGQAVGRWGNFFNREAFGGFTDGLFAMRYQLSQVGNVPQSVLDHVMTIGGVEYIQVQPTFLYESMWNVCLLIIIVLFKKHKKFDGQVGSLYLIGYGLGRIWIEGLRTDQLLLWNTNIPVSQIVSAAIIAVGLVIYISRKNASKKNLTEEI